MKDYSTLRFRALLLVVVTTAGACSIGRTDPSEKRMEVTLIDGAGTIRGEGGSKKLTSSSAIDVGDRIDLRKGSIAQIRLAEGREFEVADAVLVITGRSSLQLLRGDLIATLKNSASVDARNVVASASSGIMRIDKGLRTRVANYAGGKVNASNQTGQIDVSGLRQIVIAGETLPRSAKPLKLSANDRWDQRFLQDVLDLDERLASFARGLEAQLGPGEGIEFFQQIAPPGQDISFLSAVLNDPFSPRRRADLLIGLLLATEGKGSQILGERFQQVFSLWVDGATWGLIAHQFKVTQQGLFSRILEAIERAGLRVVNEVGPAFTRPSRGRPSPRATKGGGGPSQPGATSPTPTPTSTSSSAPLPSPIRTSAPSPAVSIVDCVFGVVSDPRCISG